MKAATTFLRSSGAAKWSLIFPALLLSVAVPLDARPPTPPEVVDHVKNRIGGLFNRIGRAIERAAEDEEERYERYERRTAPREQRYYEERYYEPVPPPQSRRVVPPPPPEYYYLERESPRLRRQDEYYPPEYSPRRQYVEPLKPGEKRKPAPPLAPPPQEIESPSTQRHLDRENAASPDPRPAPSEPSKLSSPASDEKVEYATPVPNKAGFVYPPGMKQEAGNMIDVRDMRPGQKARDPRTGKVFLVP